jgi:hypothetical protein
MIRHLCGALLILAPLYLQAGQLNVEYSKFYSHLKKIDKEETQGLQFSFGFMHNIKKQLCTINSAELITQKIDIEVAVNESNRFTLPVEKALKLANAIVAIELVEPSNQCDMSVQLETKPNLLNKTLTAEQLRSIMNQYDEFFDNMGSFLSFLMPSVDGLTIILPTNSSYGNTTLPKDSLNGNMLTLTKDWIDKNQQELELPATPIRITAIAR